MKLAFPLARIPQRTAPLALRVMNVGGLRDAHSIQISDNTMYWVFGSYSILRYLDSRETLKSLPLSFDNRTMTNIMVVQDEYNVSQYQWANTVAIGNCLHFRPRRMPGENVSPSMYTSFFPTSLLARFKIFYEKQDSFTKLTMSNMSSVRIIIKFINYRQTANVSLDWVSPKNRADWNVGFLGKYLITVEPYY